MNKINSNQTKLCKYGHKNKKKFKENQIEYDS